MSQTRRPIGSHKRPKHASRRRNCYGRLPMVTILPNDFKDFLQLLHEKKVEYLLVGGYAVIYYGYPRTTGDIDIWIARTGDNAKKIMDVLQAFGFGSEDVAAEVFLEPNTVHRMGVPPIRIELLTDISGVNFADCWAARETTVIEGIQVNVISRDNLRINKKASGRLKDLNDLEQLP